VSTIDSHRFYSNSAAKSPLQVAAGAKSGGFGDNPSAIRVSFAQPQSIPDRAMDRNMQYQYGDL
jgi:hypothetical protein